MNPLQTCVVILCCSALMCGAFMMATQAKRNARLFGDVTIINADTKQTTVLPSGSPLSLGAVRTGLRLSFQCKQGTCQSCVMLIDGKVTRACITKVPSKASITIGAAPKKKK